MPAGQTLFRTHRVLITAAIALAALTAAWGLWTYARAGSGAALCTAALGVLAGLGGSVYLRWFRKKNLPEA